MLKIVFGVVIVLISVSPWAYFLLTGGLSGGTGELEEEITELKLEVIAEKSNNSNLSQQIEELEADVEAFRSKAEFLEESMMKTEGQMSESNKEKDALEEQVKILRGELADVEERLLAETNRANTLETVNEELGARLDQSIQEVRRLQTIVRTLSNN